MTTKYQINKGVNRSIEFKGIKAQYIIYLCLGFIVLLLLFVILYLIEVNTYLGLIIVLILGITFYFTVQHYSKKYGEHGLAKHAARKQLPSAIISSTRACFTILSSKDHEAKTKNGGSTPHMEG
jgi:4-hydroxybenzoate polyprenyltransferase